MKYNDYKLNDFINDDFFVKWVKHPDAESNFFWDSWLEKNPEKLEEVIRAKDLIASIQFKNTYFPTEEEYMEVLENVHREKVVEKPKVLKLLFESPLKKVAASIILLMAFGLYFTYQYNNVNNENLAKNSAIHYTEKITQKGQKLTVTLPDGSIVKLNAESYLKIPEKFDGKERKVWLKGEAFFEVVRDTTRPFRIESEGLLTTVLGTSFNIKSYPEEKIQKVTVATGKVSVQQIDKESNPVNNLNYLLPKQALIYDKSTDENLIKRNINLEKEIAWTVGKLVYENESLENILKDLERWYGVEIHIGADVNQSGNYTGTFDNKTLENVLQGLSFTTKSFNYKIDGKTVWLTR